MHYLDRRAVSNPFEAGSLIHPAERAAAEAERAARFKPL